MKTKSILMERELACFLVGLTAFLPVNSHGLGFRIPNQDAEATARGNAFIATADTPAALYYNPAGITQLDGQYFQYGLHVISVNSHYESFTGEKVDSEFELIPVPQMYYTHSLKDLPFSFGLGIYAPFGLGLEWDKHSPIRTLAIEGRLLYATINPVMAWKASETFSIAVGPTVNYSRAKLRQGIGFTRDDEFDFNGEDFDYGFTAGVLWKFHPQWSVGATYRHETTMNYRGSSIIRPYAPATGTTAELEFPRTIAGGISFRPTPKWNIEADVDWTDWDTLNDVIFERHDEPDVIFPLNWHSSFLYHLGATRYLDNNYFVSAGYFFSENSTSTRNFTPVVPDTDLHVGSVGFGYKGERWQWAVSGQLITGPSREVNGSQSTSPIGRTADGEYYWFNGALNFSLGYHF